MYYTLYLHTWKEECIINQSQTLDLIQLCLFISLEGYNRWKVGSSVSNKLDKQTNSCVVLFWASFQNAKIIHLEEKKLSIWNKSVWIYSLVVNRRLKTTKNMSLSVCDCFSASGTELFLSLEACQIRSLDKWHPLFSLLLLCYRFTSVTCLRVRRLHR